MFFLFPAHTPEANEFLDMLAGIQGSRMNDQRASLPQFPGLNSQAVINQYLRSRMDEDVPDDNFFEMLMRCQVCNGVWKHYDVLKCHFLIKYIYSFIVCFQNGITMKTVKAT